MRINKNKIITLDKAEKLVESFKSNKKKIVLCHGVFDLLHVGHIKHFKQAKSFGDILIVSLTEDKYVNKGSNRPAFNLKLRSQAIAALEYVDYIIINKGPTAIKTITKIKPNVYCKGPDYKNHKDDLTGMIKKEITAIKSVKGKIKYTDSETFSSSKLLNKYGEIFNQDQQKFLELINKKYNFRKIQSLISNFKKIKVLVIGEIIIDEYIFCEALGKSGKEPILVLRDLFEEKYIGGTAAIAGHLSNFCSNVTLLSMLGSDLKHKTFINKNLPKNVKFEYIKKSSSPTIIKKRFVDNINKNKILGVYSLNDKQLNLDNEKQLQNKLKKLIPKHDLVLISDYGHGFINNKIANLILSLSSFTSLNAQINSSNIGHHSIRKYKKIDCLIINENELRHELRDKDQKISILMKKISKDMNISNLIVTQGFRGATLFNKNKNKFLKCPALANKVIDKVGSGDAMLALASLAIKNNSDEIITLFLGSLAAAQSVESIGNSKKVNKDKLLKNIKHTLL